MLSAGRPPFPPIPLHGRSTAAPSLLSPSVAARFISPSFSPCGGTIQPVLNVAEWIVPSCAQCPRTRHPHTCHFERSRPNFSSPSLLRRVGLRSEKSLFLFRGPVSPAPRTKWRSKNRNWRRGETHPSTASKVGHANSPWRIKRQPPIHEGVYSTSLQARFSCHEDLLCLAWVFPLTTPPFLRCALVSVKDCGCSQSLRRSSFCFWPDCSSP
jgi:hypothetical protein